MEDDEFVGFMMMMISYVLCCVALLGVLLAKANTPFVYHNLNKKCCSPPRGSYDSCMGGCFWFHQQIR